MWRDPRQTKCTPATYLSYTIYDMYGIMHYHDFFFLFIWGVFSPNRLLCNYNMRLWSSCYVVNEIVKGNRLALFSILKTGGFFFNIFTHTHMLPDTRAHTYLFIYSAHSSLYCVFISTNSLLICSSMKEKASRKWFVARC